jgi:hypothetical protein
MYFQVWELDEQQPRLNVISHLATLRHYRNLGKYRQLLPEFLKSARFTSIAEHSLLPSSPLAELSRGGVSGTSRKMTRPDRQRGPSFVTPHDSPTRQRSYRRPAVTLVIPCYNEEASLPYLHRTMQSLRHELSRVWDLKLLFVDDCSKDNTREVLASLFGNDRAFPPGSSPASALRTRTLWRRWMPTVRTIRMSWFGCSSFSPATSRW